MEGIVNTLKQAYYPVQINVATWDAALKLDTMTCCGLTEYGTAKSANGLEYRFAVFGGAGQMHWTGERDAWLASFSALPPHIVDAGWPPTENQHLGFGSPTTLA